MPKVVVTAQVEDPVKWLRINSSVSRARSSAEDFGMSAGDIGSVWQLRECARLAFELRMDQRQVPR